jgi:membrane fusion protein (multidrug efflux system)
VSGRFVRRLACVLILPMAGCKRSEAPPPSPPPVVEVAQAVQRDVPIHGEWTATLDGDLNAQIRAQVTGYLLSQKAREGSLVRRGEVLFELDARPFQAALDQANAELGQRIADEARANRDVERDKPLAEARAIPKAQMETDIQVHRAAVAAVEAARASVEAAALNLGFTKVRSLIDGIVGITEVQIGNLVTPTSVLTTVSQIDPIRAWFAVSEREYLDTANRIHDAALASATGGKSRLGFYITLADGAEYPHKGSFLFANRQIDSLTGTIRLAVSFPNPELLLRPGQFARLGAVTRVERGALVVPQRAVNELQGRYQVTVLQADSTVAVQPVDVGVRVDSLWVVERGLRPGQFVVVEGIQKVRPGMKVAARPYVQGPSLAPGDTQPTATLPRRSASVRPRVTKGG